MAYRTASNELQAPCSVCRTSVPREEITFEASGDPVCQACATRRTLQRLGTPPRLSPGWATAEETFSISQRMLLGAAVIGAFYAVQALVTFLDWVVHHIR